MFVMTVDGFRQSGKFNNELPTGDFFGDVIQIYFI